MATAEVNGLTLGYEVDRGRAAAVVITPGGRFTKESPGVRELAVGAGRPGQPGADLGPAELRRVRRVLRGQLPSRPCRPTRWVALLEHLDMTPGRDRGRSGGAPGVAARRARVIPRRRPAWPIWWISGGVYGLLSLATHYCGGSLAAAWTRRHGGGGRRCPSGPRSSAQPGEPAALPRPGPGDVHRHHGALDAGLLPARRASTSRGCPTPTPAPSTSRRSCSAAARATRTTPAPRRSRWPSCCRRPGWSSRRGATGSGSSARRSQDEGLFARWPAPGAAAPRVAGRERWAESAGPGAGSAPASRRRLGVVAVARGEGVLGTREPSARTKMKRELLEHVVEVVVDGRALDEPDLGKAPGHRRRGRRRRWWGRVRGSIRPCRCRLRMESATSSEPYPPGARDAWPPPRGRSGDTCSITPMMRASSR